VGDVEVMLTRIMALQGSDGGVQVVVISGVSVAEDGDEGVVYRASAGQ
jgi:hypothetical protein